MKTKALPYIKRNLCLYLFISIVSASAMSSVYAQTSTEENFAYGGKRGIRVEMKIMPSDKKFSAGIASVDSVNTKLRLWVNNGDQQRCDISIMNNSGVLWNTSFKDAYYNQVLDLSSLEDGIYQIAVSKGRLNFEKRFEIRSNTSVTRNISLQ